MTDRVLYLGGEAINLEQNLANELSNFTVCAEGIDPWALDFTAAAPVLHSSNLQGITQWARSDGTALRSHRSLHGNGAAFRKAVETTPGHTCAEDVVRGLDEYVFASVGRLAIADTFESFGVVVLDTSVLSIGTVSLRELAGFGGILLSPQERFAEHRESQVIKANQLAFEQYIRTIVPGSEFNSVFTRYLSSYFASEAEFFSSYDFIPGKKDLPPRNSVAHAELIAMAKAYKAYHEFGLPQPVAVQEGYHYGAPQLIVKDEIPAKYVKGVLFYSDDRTKELKSALKAVDQAGFPTQIVGSDNVNACLPLVTKEIFRRSRPSANFLRDAVQRAMFNICFANVAAQLPDTN